MSKDWVCTWVILTFDMRHLTKLKSTWKLIAQIAAGDTVIFQIQHVTQGTPINISKAQFRVGGTDINVCFLTLSLHKCFFSVQKIQISVS